MGSELDRHRHADWRSACRALTLLGTVLTAACQADAAGAPSAVTRDSAGVQIVEYAALPQDVPHWTASDAADLVIGTADGDSNTVFGRIGGVAARGNAEIAIADGGAQQIRIFDATGAFRLAAGGTGAGPGEFTSLGPVFWTAGDSLVAVNFFSRALAVFDADGAYGRTVQLAEPGVPGYGNPVVQGVLSNGDLVITAASDYDLAAPMGYQRDDLLLMLYDPSGAPRRELGAFPDIELTIEDMNGRTIARPLEMARYTIVVARDSIIVAASTDRFEVRKHDAAGALTHIIRVALPPRPVDGAIRSQYIEHAVSQVDEQDRTRVRPMIEKGVLPEQLPAIDDVRIDGAGNVWVKEFAMPGEARTPSWWVFDASGTIVASAALPAGLTHVTIGGDHVLGVAFESLGVATVLRYPMQRN